MRSVFFKAYIEYGLSCFTGVPGDRLRGYEIMACYYKNG